jgi:cell division protein FtsN
MNSTTNYEVTEPDHVLIARADERLAHAYEQIASADEHLARVNEQILKLEQDAVRHPAAVPRRVARRGRPALRGFVGLLLAAGIFAAAFVSQSSHGDTAKMTFASWIPQLVLASPEKPGLPAQPSPSAVQVAAADGTLPHAAIATQPAASEVAPTPAPLPPELAQLLQTMARDLANVQQGIEQLKASQEQMASDQAKAVEQLKANQEQVTRLVARTSEQNTRPRTPTPPPPPIAGPAHKPAVPARSLPQARAQPHTPVQLQPDDQ